MSIGQPWMSVQHTVTSDLHGKEFTWTDADFVKVQTLIYQRAGICLHDGKHAMARIT